MKKETINSKPSAATEDLPNTTTQNHSESDNTPCDENIQDVNLTHYDLTLINLKKRRKFINREAEKLSMLTGITIDSAEAVVVSRENYVLDDKDILFLDQNYIDFITIEQLLDGGEKHHLRSFKEPLSSESMEVSHRLCGDKKDCTFRYSKVYPIIVSSSDYGRRTYRFARFEREKADKGFRFINVEKLDNHHSDWLIVGYLEAGKIVLIFGPPASFKSFVVLSMGLSIATGIDWHGQEVKQGIVLYICGEGHSGIKKRIVAFENHHNTSCNNFMVSSSPVQMLSEKCLDEIETEAEKVFENSIGSRTIIIDTLNRNFGDGDENSTVDMTKFIMGIDRLSNRLKCAIIIVHHSGLGDTERGRGSSALLGAVDFAYSCKVENGPSGDKLITIKSTKIKDHAPPEPKTFHPLEVEIGTDTDGNPISSVVLSETSLPAKASKLATTQRIALDALKAADANGDASEAAWRAEAYAKSITPSDVPATKRKTFDRAKKHLLDQGLVVVRDDKYEII